MTELRVGRLGPAGTVVERAMDRAAGSRPIPGNRVQLLFDGPEVFPAMLDRIASARRWIHLDNYIIRSDRTGRRFAAALAERARAGVRVRVLTDWMGSLTTGSRFWRELRRAGVSVRFFGPPRLLPLTRNLVRDHRKVLVVDGQVSVVGGLCLGDEWEGNPARGRQPWRDSAIAVDGPAAGALDRAFARLWGRVGESLPDDELASEVAPSGPVDVRVIAGEPGGVRAWRTTELLLAGAAERLWVTDAYLVAPRSVFQALRDAATDRVDVRLLVPGTSDLPHVRNLTRIGYRRLLESGVRIFEWRGAMLHAKTVVADGRWVRIGSSNLNFSSLLDNWELDVLVDDERLAREMENRFRRDLDQSVEVRARPVARRRTPLPASVLNFAAPTEALPHRPGLRERRRRTVVALRAVAGAARRGVVLSTSLALAILAGLFFFLPRAMAVVVLVLSLWVALSTAIDAVQGD